MQTIHFFKSKNFYDDIPSTVAFKLLKKLSDAIKIICVTASNLTDRLGMYPVKYLQ